MIITVTYFGAALFEYLIKQILHVVLRITKVGNNCAKVDLRLRLLNVVYPLPGWTHPPPGHTPYLDSASHQQQNIIE